MKNASLMTFTIGLLLALLFAAGGPIRAQRSDRQRGSITINTDLVIIDVHVTDQNNQPVFNLFNKEDFTVFEDDVKQEIAQISRDDAPVSFGLVIDTSGSMIAILPMLCDSAFDLVRRIRPGDEAFVAQFRDEPELVQDFTFDRRKLEVAIGELYSSGNNSLFDAIIATADYAKEKAKNRRKVLVVFTDGQELKDNPVKEKEAIEAINQNGVQAYFVGILGKNPYYKSSTKKDKDLLLRLASGSGGRALFPKNAGEIRAVAAQVVNDLGAQYVLSYYPTNDKRDGTFRSVKVIINDNSKRKLIARARQGYYARKEYAH
ncbi:MAG TPA: VWA domain-containing protein [Blastocatellia bacterium]|nr:VWA domain-containing protein [Blastocatellia bacterium]